MDTIRSVVISKMYVIKSSRGTKSLWSTRRNKVMDSLLTLGVEEVSFETKVVVCRSITVSGLILDPY